jgi:hypothetical protein
MEPSSVQPGGQWAFNPEGGAVGAQQSSVALKEPAVVSWSASEFIAYQKNAGWYLIALLGLLTLAGVVFLLSQDLISSGSIIIIGFLFLIYAARKPRVLNYSVGTDGIHIGEKLYPYSSLKSFAVIDEGSLRSISLIPMQRFMPAISMYFEPQEEAKIVDALNSYIPREDRKQDAIDRMMHRIRF